MSDLMHHLIIVVIAIATYDLLFVEPRLKAQREETEIWERLCKLNELQSRLKDELINRLINEGERKE